MASTSGIKGDSNSSSLRTRKMVVTLTEISKSAKEQFGVGEMMHFNSGMRSVKCHCVIKEMSGKQTEMQHQSMNIINQMKRK